MAEEGKCRVCGKGLVWLRSHAGNLVCLDAQASSDGDTVILDGLAYRVADDLFSERVPGPRYTQHSCTKKRTKQ